MGDASIPQPGAQLIKLGSSCPGFSVQGDSSLDFSYQLVRFFEDSILVLSPYDRVFKGLDSHLSQVGLAGILVEGTEHVDAVHRLCKLMAELSRGDPLIDSKTYQWAARESREGQR